MVLLPKVAKRKRYYTPTQRRILDVLADGEPHPRKELFRCLGDDLSNIKTVGKHICVLRKKLPLGELIVCELRGYSICYRHVLSLLTRYQAG